MLPAGRRFRSAAVDDMLLNNTFGAAGSSVVIEEFLTGGNPEPAQHKWHPLALQRFL